MKKMNIMYKLFELIKNKCQGPSAHAFVVRVNQCFLSCFEILVCLIPHVLSSILPQVCRIASLPLCV